MESFGDSPIQMGSEDNRSWAPLTGHEISLLWASLVGAAPEIANLEMIHTTIVSPGIGRNPPKLKILKVILVAGNGNQLWLV